MRPEDWLNPAKYENEESWKKYRPKGVYTFPFVRVYSGIRRIRNIYLCRSHYMNHKI